MAARESATVLLLNYRADGTPFWNEVSVAPLLGADGELTHFVGVQNDVTARVISESSTKAPSSPKRKLGPRSSHCWRPHRSGSDSSIESCASPGSMPRSLP